MSTNEKIPNRVREIRENRLMTQAQLARKAKVALRTIHSVEKGMNCRMDTKRKILLALGLRFEDKDFVFPSRGGSMIPPMHQAAPAAATAPSESDMSHGPGSSEGGMSGGGMQGGGTTGGGIPGSGSGGWSGH